SKWETVYVKWNEILKSMMPVTIKSERWGLYGK
ncbi:MAG: hypothetical protein PWP48_2080, partial [Clostridiales bacterium]|nr:hypothetical protein [Clostridiales bacterium]